MATIVLNFGLASIVVIAGTAVGVPEYPLDSLTEGHGGRFTGVIVGGLTDADHSPIGNGRRGGARNTKRGVMVL